jgi:RimJ/RimL family protein N-acetyltransferase
MFRLRLVQIDDIDLIFSWRNDPSIRYNSSETGVIEYITHETWFRNRLNTLPIEPFYVLERNSQDAICRFDVARELDRCFYISIMVNPDLHGRGIGTVALRKSCNEVFKQYPNWKILAKIKSNNTSSKRLFESCHFQFERQDDEFIYYLKTWDFKVIDDKCE